MLIEENSFSFFYNSRLFIIIIIVIIRVFSPRAGPSLQTQEQRPQFCLKAGLSPQNQESRLQFYYSVFLFLWRATYKLSSEAGNGEVTNPK